MSATAIDTNRLIRALKATGKSENFSAEDLVGAFDVAQSDGDLVTRTYFDARLTGVEARFERLEARLDNFDAKLDTMRAEMRLWLKSGQLQSFYWLACIILVGNGAVIALLGRVARLY